MVSDYELKPEGWSSPLLGIEAKSILRSIQTEDLKLEQSPQLSRSDLHYFRARYNYYRLSLLRLPPEERSVLEPFMGRFYDRIMRTELNSGTIPESPRPFLQSVAKPTVPDAGNVSQTPAPSFSNSLSKNADIISELRLIKLSLAADLSPEAKKILAESIDRVISKLN